MSDRTEGRMNDRMAFAKRRYSAACEAVLEGRPEAQQLCEEALRELEAARKEAERRRLRAVPERQR